MRIATQALLATVIVIATVLPAQAGPHRSEIYDRMDRQSAAIERGARSGRLTWRDAERLRAEQRSLYDLARDLRLKGLEPRESHAILAMRLERSERHLRELSHSRDERRGHYSLRPPSKPIASPRRAPARDSHQHRREDSSPRQARSGRDDSDRGRRSEDSRSGRSDGASSRTGGRSDRSTSRAARSEGQRWRDGDQRGRGQGG